MPHHRQRSGLPERGKTEEVRVILKRRSQRLASLAILAGLIGGCGAAAGPAAGDRPMSASQATGQQPSFDLQLTDQQEKQLQAITQKYASQTSQEDAQRQAQQIQQILTAERVDTRKLVQLLERDREQIIQALRQTPNVMAEIRQILTAKQQQTFAAMQDSLAQQAEQGDQGAAGPQGGGAALPRAIGSFMRSGDVRALQAAVNDAIRQIPSSEQVANSLAGLSLEQRKQMFNQ